MTFKIYIQTPYGQDSDLICLYHAKLLSAEGANSYRHKQLPTSSGDEHIQWADVPILHWILSINNDTLIKFTKTIAKNLANYVKATHVCIHNTQVHTEYEFTKTKNSQEIDIRCKFTKRDKKSRTQYYYNFICTRTSHCILTAVNTHETMISMHFKSQHTTICCQQHQDTHFMLFCKLLLCQLRQIGD